MINAKFEIDPNRNGGLKFQYDVVERSLDERKKMHARDCECCREVSAVWLKTELFSVCPVL